MKTFFRSSKSKNSLKSIEIKNYPEKIYFKSEINRFSLSKVLDEAKQTKFNHRPYTLKLEYVHLN